MRIITKQTKTINMLSNLVVTNQKFVLIIDELNRERISQKFIGQLLHEQGQDSDTIKSLPGGTQLKHGNRFETLISECISNNNNNSSNEEDVKLGYNIVLPTLADLLCYQKPAYIFDFLNKLRRAKYVKRIFLWASPQHLQHPHSVYILAGCERLAEIVLRLEAQTTLSVLTRKPGGGVTNKRYSCEVSKTQFLVTPIATTLTAEASKDSQNKNTTVDDAAAKTAEIGATFKIELDEDEVVARNALTLPYERKPESGDGNIIYTPDANDDFDEEDPDEDLCI